MSVVIQDETPSGNPSPREMEMTDAALVPAPVPCPPPVPLVSSVCTTVAADDGQGESVSKESRFFGASPYVEEGQTNVMVALQTLRGSFALACPSNRARGAESRASNRKLEADHSLNDDYNEEKRSASPSITSPIRLKGRDTNQTSAATIECKPAERRQARTTFLPTAKALPSIGRQRTNLADILDTTTKGPDAYRSTPTAPVHTYPHAPDVSKSIDKMLRARERKREHHHGHRRTKVRRNHRNEMMSSNKIPPEEEKWWRSNSAVSTNLGSILGELRRSLMREPRRI